MFRVRLYACNESPYCRSVKGQLLRLGVEHEEIVVDWRGLREGPVAHEVCRLNPKGQVPILVLPEPEGPLILPDSFLITAALERRFGMGPAWMESRDALLYRTADVELRDAMMALYRLPRPPGASTESGEAPGPLDRAAGFVSSLLPLEPENASSAGALHAAFLLDACVGLAHRAGQPLPEDVRGLHARLMGLAPVHAVCLAYSRET